MHADRNTAIALAAVLAVWFFGSLIAAKGLFSQETAAWVQAIGAVAAIMAAGWTAQLPIRAAAEKAAQDHDRELDEISIAMGDAQEMFADLRQALDRGDRVLIDCAYIEFRKRGDEDAALRSWLTLPARDWPNVSLYVRANRLVAEISEFRSLNQLSPKPETLERHVKLIDAAAKKLSRELFDAKHY